MMDIFDLKKVKFPEKKRLVNPPSSSDLGVNVIFDKRKGQHFVTLSLKKDITDTLPCQYVSAAVVEGKGATRLYIVSLEEGYKLQQPNKSVKRVYARIPADNYIEFSKFVGEHDLHYDKFNAAYYVEM